MDNNRIERFFIIYPMRMEVVDWYSVRNNSLCLDLFFDGTRKKKSLYLYYRYSAIRQDDQVLLYDQTMQIYASDAARLIELCPNISITQKCISDSCLSRHDRTHDSWFTKRR